MSAKNIYYSDKYTDEKYEYRKKHARIEGNKTVHRHIFWRQFTDTFEDSSPTLLETVHRHIFFHKNVNEHVMLPKEIAKLVPKGHLMSEAEWRSIGVQQSQGWIHYMKHDPEPHILLFRRPLTNQ